jgi:hypothetical protein
MMRFRFHFHALSVFRVGDLPPLDRARPSMKTTEPKPMDLVLATVVELRERPIQRREISFSLTSSDFIDVKNLRIVITKRK